MNSEHNIVGVPILSIAKRFTLHAATESMSIASKMSRVWIGLKVVYLRTIVLKKKSFKNPYAAQPFGNVFGFELGVGGGRCGRGLETGGALDDLLLHQTPNNPDLLDLLDFPDLACLLCALGIDSCSFRFVCGLPCPH